MNSRPTAVEGSKWTEAELGLCHGSMAFPRQCPGLCWAKHVPGTIPMGTVDLDTLVYWRREYSPTEMRQAALLGLSTTGLSLASSATNHSQQNRSEKSWKHDLNLLSQWTGKTKWLAIGKWNKKPGILKPRSWTLTWNTSLTECLFFLAGA